MVVVTRSRRDPSGAARDQLDAAPVSPDSHAPDGDDIGRRATLDGEHRGTQRQHRGRPEEGDRKAAAGQVAVAHEPDRDPVSQSCQQLPARLAQADDPNPGRTAGPDEPCLEGVVIDALHGRDGATDA